MQPILFPGIGLEINIPRIAFHLLGRDVYWYGIIITCGLLISLLIAKKDKEKYHIDWDDITTFLINAIIVGFVCARLYYVVFKWEYYSQHLDEIVKIWNGGIAIYGGVIGAMVTGIVFCKVKKIPFLSLCDFCVPYLSLAQSIGRWGNFINREAYGSETTSILRMGIFDSQVNDYIFVHPTFLYESIATFFIFMILLWVKKKQKFEGQLFYLYMILYGLARSLIEGLRTDSLYLGNFRISQVLAILFVCVFSTIYYMKRHQKVHQAE